MSEQEKLYIANNLRKLVKEHKINCNDPSCVLSGFLVYQYFYAPFIGEDEAKKHFADFI